MSETAPLSVTPSSPSQANTNAANPAAKSKPADDLARNAATRKRQKLAMYAMGCGILLAGGAWILSAPAPQQAGEDVAGQEKPNAAATIKISTDDMVNRSMADKEWMALSENQLTTQGNQIKTLQGETTRFDQLQKQIEDLQGQNQSLKADGSKVLSAYQTENDQLRSQLSALSTQVQRATAGPNALYGTGAPSTYQRAATAPAGSIAPSGASEAASAAPAQRNIEVKLMSFNADGARPRSSPTARTICRPIPLRLPKSWWAWMLPPTPRARPTRFRSCCASPALPARSMPKASCSGPIWQAAWSMARR
jgi:conjugal transfer pilus assembly protein TraB